MDGVTDRIAALVAELGDDAQVGFHGHENLGLGVANSVLAARAGAKQIDGSTRRFGAGAGNTPVEAFAGVFERLGIKTGIDTLKIIDAAEDVVRPAMPAECLLDRCRSSWATPGVYSSFLKHADIAGRAATACPAPSSSSRPASASSSAGRKTSSSRSRWRSSVSRRRAVRKPSHTSLTASAKAAVTLSRLPSIKGNIECLEGAIR